MAPLGFSPDRAERIHDQLDRDLSLVENRLERIRAAVPQAGATTLRLDDAREITREVVGDLHDVVNGRTVVAAR